jgi:hypothetical protein
LAKDPALQGYLNAASTALANYPAAVEAYPAKLAEHQTAKDA